MKMRICLHYKYLSLFLISLLSLQISVQGAEHRIDLPLNRIYLETQIIETLYYDVYIKEKIEGEILSVLAIAQTKESSTKIELYIEGESSKNKVIGEDEPDILCDYAMVNICNIPNERISFQKEFKIIIAVTCYQNCSYQLEAQYTGFKKLELDNKYYYFNDSYNQKDLIVYTQGWFSIPQNKGIVQVRIQLFEQYPNTKILPLTILCNPGRSPISGNTAKYKSVQGVLNSAILTLDTADIKESEEFTVLLSFPSSSFVQIRLESFNGGVSQLTIGDFTQGQLGPNEKMIYKLVNLLDNKNVSFKTLVITLVSQIGNASMKLAGKNIPASDSEYLFVSSDDYFEQRLEITGKQRRELQLDDNVFHLLISPIGNYLEYLIKVEWMDDSSEILERLIFNIQTHHIAEVKSIDHFQFAAYGNDQATIDLKLTQHNGDSIVLVRNCYNLLTDCKLTEAESKEILYDADYYLKIANVTAFSSLKNSHALAITNEPSKCPKQYGMPWCKYYLAVINPNNSTQKYSVLASFRSEYSITIKPNEILFDSVLPKSYKYYSLNLPPDMVGVIDEVVISLTSSTTTTVVGVNISEKGSSEFPTIDKAEICNMNDFIILRRSKVGNLNSLKLLLFVYSVEWSFFNLQVTYKIASQINPKLIFHDQFVSGIISSYEDSEYFQVFIARQYLGDPDLKLILKPIEGAFNFRFCQSFVNQTLSDCTWSENNQLIMEKNKFKTQSVTGYIEIIPLVPEGVDTESVHQSLQFRFGVFLSTSLTNLVKNEPYFEYLAEGEIRYFQVPISSEDSLKIYLTADAETAEGTNVYGYLSADPKIMRPTENSCNNKIKAGVPFKLPENETGSICKGFAYLNRQCMLYLTVQATKKGTSFNILVSKNDSVVRLYNKIKHSDEYPSEGGYRRYYLLLESTNTTYIMQIQSQLAKLNVYFNFFDASKQIDFFPDDETIYPRQEKHDYEYQDNQYGHIITLDLDRSVFSSHACLNKTKCFIAISIRVNPNEYTKDLIGQEYTLQLFSDNIPLLPHQRSIYFIRNDQHYYFQISLPSDSSRYILNINPIGQCDVNTSIIKLGQEENKHTFSQPGGSFISIDQFSFPWYDTIKGNYMVTISTSDSYCIFYVVGYDTPYQYVKVESGHFFNSVLQMNEFLFLEYQHISDDISFKVEASVEEGIIQMGIIKEDGNWSPTIPIINYSLNNLVNLRKHTIEWDLLQDINKPCNKCKYIVGISALRESRLSVVVKQQDSYSVVPGQRMFKIQQFENTSEYLHFFPHQKDFSLQVTLLSGNIEVGWKEDYVNVWEQLSPNSFSLTSDYSSSEHQIVPSKNLDNSTYSTPFSIKIFSKKESNYIISFQSNDRIMHLASGFPYFKTLNLNESVTLQYQQLSGDYQNTTEFSFYYLSDIYQLNQDKVVKKIQERTKQIQENPDDKKLEYLQLEDFYPKIIIEDQKLEQTFQMSRLSVDAQTFFGESNSNTFQIKIHNNSPGLIEINQPEVKFYIVPHSGMQHLLPNKQVQKKTFQGSTDYYELYSRGVNEILFEVLQCYGSSLLTIQPDLELSSSQSQLNVTTISAKRNLFVQVISPPGNAGLKDTVDYYNYFATVYSQQQSEYIIKANAYPSGTIYPYQYYDSGSSFETSYNAKTKQLEVTFDGLSCAYKCESKIFQLLYVSYTFDSDYLAASNSQGKALCYGDYGYKHLKYFTYYQNITYDVQSNIYSNNTVNHKSLNVDIDIEDMLDKYAEQLRVDSLYISLNAKAMFYNSLTKQAEVHNFPYNSVALNVVWIENARSKNKRIAMIFGYVILGILFLGGLAYAILKMIRKSRRRMQFEMQDALNTSISTQPSHNLQVNLNQIEMNKFDQKYSSFVDEEEVQESDKK